MERISTVARDRSARPHCWSVLIIAAVACVELVSLSWGADPSRPAGKARRPQRPTSQTQRPTSEQSADSRDAFEAPGDVDPAADVRENPPPTNPVSDPLPQHVHPKHPLVPALKMAYASRGTLRTVRDYSAQFVKKERIGTQYIVHSMDMLFREQPFSVYLEFREPNVGRQVLYVQGANNNQLLAKEAGIKGLVGTVPLNPTDPMAMSESRHPITQIGISNMLEAVIRQWEEEAKFGEIDVQYYPNAKLSDFPVRMIRTMHPTRRRQFNFHMTRIFLDDKTLFPVRVEQYDWPQREGGEPVLVELYMYSGVRTNQGFTDQTFDPRKYRLR
ncbi:MAG: DUF1571 domain-containing protein [Planctomycetota bacterium]